MNFKELILSKRLIEKNNKNNKLIDSNRINIESDIASSHAITLISLVITVIILIILAGVAINLGLGPNGIFERSKQARKQNEEAAAKEKLETVLAEAIIEKETNENYNSKGFLDNMLKEKGMTVNENSVIVGTYNFEIDRDKLEIVSNSSDETSFVIETPYIGTTSFKVNIFKVYNEEEVKEYAYIIDGNEEKITTEKEYIKEGLEPETIHTANVIVKYKNGKTVASNIINLKLEPRIYLFKEGDECKDITGGWKALAIADNSTSSTSNQVNPVIPNFTLNKEEGYMNLYLKSTQGFQSGGLIINNKIDYKEYKKICVEITATLGKYNSGSAISIYRNTSEPNWGADLCYTNPITEKKKFEQNIEKSDEDIFIYIQSHKNDGEANCNIYNIWLEK